MKRRLVVVLLMLVLLPALALTALGVRLVATEREQTETRTRSILMAQLAQHDTRLQEVLQSRALGSMHAVPDTLDIQVAQAALATTGAVRHVFLLMPNMRMVFPTTPEVESREAGVFNRYVTQLWRNRDPAFIPLSEQAPASDTEGKGAHGLPGAAAMNQGWHTWYDETGLRFLFWWRQDNGGVLGAELDRVRLMADLIAALPDTVGPAADSSGGRYAAAPYRMELIDARGQEVYRWGSLEPAAGAHPAASLGLGAPFRAWRLDAYLAPEPAPRGLVYATGLGLGGLVLAVAGLAIYFYRESTRALRDAAQRVTFANQVSHELKTPLTNIRMYAELLESDLALEGRARERIHVIVSESQRLSRLIGNMLTFSLKQRHKLQLRPRVGRVGEAVDGVLAHARPALEQRGVDTHIRPPEHEAQVEFDQDVVEQVVNNLVSNVEKYAASGGFLGVSWALEQGITRIRVEDAGPGVPEAEEARIFLPFHRVSNRLTDGVSGTGLGLALARDLCHLHGGDLTMTRRAEGGLCFEASFATPPRE